MSLKNHYFLRFHLILKNLMFRLILMYLKIHCFLMFPMNLKNPMFR
jgi:hypothetical protein